MGGIACRFGPNYWLCYHRVSAYCYRSHHLTLEKLLITWQYCFCGFCTPPPPWSVFLLNTGSMLPGDFSSSLCLPGWTADDTGAGCRPEGPGRVHSLPVPMPLLLVGRGIPASALKLENKLQHVQPKVIHLCPLSSSCENTLLWGCLLHKIVDSGQGNGPGAAGALLSQLLLSQGEEALGTWGSCWGPGSLTPQSLCVMDMVCHGSWERAQRAGVSHGALQTVASCPHSYCLAGSSHSFALR